MTREEGFKQATLDQWIITESTSAHVYSECQRNFSLHVWDLSLAKPHIWLHVKLDNENSFIIS